jgi:hypothetical protein
LRSDSMQPDVLRAGIAGSMRLAERAN